MPWTGSTNGASPGTSVAPRRRGPGVDAADQILDPADQGIRRSDGPVDLEHGARGRWHGRRLHGRGAYPGGPAADGDAGPVTGPVTRGRRWEAGTLREWRRSNPQRPPPPGRRGRTDTPATGADDRPTDGAGRPRPVRRAGRHAHSPGRAPRRRWSILRLAGTAVLLLWAVGLGTLSTVVYHRNFLAEDFATYNQAWTLIGTGHLNPFDTVYGYPFVKSDFELIMWPLALVHLVLPQPVVLLWIQDLAIAGTGIVSFAWITEYLERKDVDWGWAVTISAAVLVVVIVNPGVYRTLQFDIHLEPLATFFLVLAGRDLWHGRRRRAWIWVAVVLLCGSFATVTVVGLGISALLAGRETRRSGSS